MYQPRYTCTYMYHRNTCNKKSIYICMDANVHAYMHIYTDRDALCTHKYEKRKEGKKKHTNTQYADTHTPMHAYMHGCKCTCLHACMHGHRCSLHIQI